MYTVDNYYNLFVSSRDAPDPQILDPAGSESGSGSRLWIRPGPGPDPDPDPIEIIRVTKNFFDFYKVLKI